MPTRVSGNEFYSNTWTGDTPHTLPIYIFLGYGGKFSGFDLSQNRILTAFPNILKFPLNPESLPKEISSQSEVVNITGLGDVSIPKKPKLSKFTISSFFWQEINVVPSSFYVMWLEKWQASGKPAFMFVTRFNYSMWVTCENFKHYIKAGEEDNIYFDLELQEWKPYGAKKLNAKKSGYDTFTDALAKSNEFINDWGALPILVEIPRPCRSGTMIIPTANSNESRITNPYIVKENETLLTITKLITGNEDGWMDLYNANKSVIAESYSQNQAIPVGTKLELPESWIEA